MEKDLTIDDLKAEASKLESEINSLKNENSASIQTNELLKKENNELQLKVDSDKKDFASRMKKAEEDNEKRVAELKLENENLLSRLTAENTTAASLDEYKKRAQAALKKVSSSLLLLLPSS